MSPEEKLEKKGNSPPTHRLSPESSETKIRLTAGLLAFRIARAFPSLKSRQWLRLQAIISADHSCGDSSGFQLALTGIPF